MSKLLDDEETVGVYLRMNKDMWRRFRIAAVRNEMSAAMMLRTLVMDFVKKSGE